MFILVDQIVLALAVRLRHGAALQHLANGLRVEALLLGRLQDVGLIAGLALGAVAAGLDLGNDADQGLAVGYLHHADTSAR